MSEILDAMLGGKGRADGVTAESSRRVPGAGYGDAEMVLTQEQSGMFWSSAGWTADLDLAERFDGIEAARKAVAPLRKSEAPAWVGIVKMCDVRRK